MSEPIAIPVLDLQPQIDALRPRLDEAFHRVLDSRQFILGPEEQAFEREAAAYLGAKHAVGLNSGTDALFIALRALDIKPGDEVITTPFTFFATAEATSHVGATPVFVDIEEASFNLDPARLERAITPRTKAILPVHLFGRPCDLGGIQAVAERHGLKVVEDCAQSFGAAWEGRRTGSVGAMGAFSFFPTKNLNAFGDGGMLTTDDDELAGLARMLRVHGSRRKYYNEKVGYNSRLDELQAAMLRVKLPLIDGWNAGRRKVAERYNEAFAKVPGLVVPAPVPGHVFHQYTLRIQGPGRRDAVHNGLAARGIGTMVYYPVPVHRLKLYEATHAATSCPVAEAMSQEVLSLPMWPELAGTATQERVIDALLSLVP